MKTILLSFFTCISFIGFTQTGINWGTTGDVATSNFGNNFPRIVVDGAGNPVVSWGNGDYMMFARWNGSSFSTPDTISDQGLAVANSTWMGPDIASHGDTIYAIYKETPENDANSKVWCVNSFDAGQTFSAPVQVNTFTADSMTRFPTITADDNGNPIAAFMEFNPDFTNARWVVAKSTDYGSTYGSDVLASGWSSPTSEVCDCCPGFITSSGNNVAILYRDNNSNIRDTWAGLSTDGGVSFSNGMDVDQKAWNLNSCPSSGPDGFLLGDTLYSTFLNGASGENEVYFSNSHFPSSTGSPGIELNNVTSGEVQNYPRSDNSGNIAAYCWRENSLGQSKVLLRFAEDITSGLPTEMDTVANEFVVSCDIALSSTQVVVVWQDFNSGTIKYRIGTFPGVGISENQPLDVEVYPNPSQDQWWINGADVKTIGSYVVYDMNGEVVLTGTNDNSDQITLNGEKLASGVYFFRAGQFEVKLIKN